MACVLRKLFPFLVFLSGVFYDVNAFAYPTTIGQGYESCRTCHYSAYGGGPLNDYGRALGSTEMAAKWFTPEISDEKIAEDSDFLGPLGTLPEWLKLQGSFRRMILISGLESQSKSRWIQMQAEGTAVVTAPDEKWFAVATLGYIPVPESTPRNERDGVKTLISREHSFSYQINPEFLAQVGYFDPTYGIRIAEHSAFIRTQNLVNMNDQTHGALVHWQKEKFTLGGHLFLGNLFQTKKLQMSGGSASFEYTVADHAQLGASALMAQNGFRTRQQAAAHYRMGFLPDSALLVQWGLLKDVPKTGAAERFGDAGFVQGTSRITRGFFGLLTLERFRADLTQSSPTYYRAGPGIQVFPVNRVEFRFDFQIGHTESSSAVSPDVYLALAQLHVWL